MKKTILLFLICFVPTFAQKLSNEEKEILTLQDQRSLGSGKLVAYLSSPDETLRYRAAVALANIQDTSTVVGLLPMLKDKSVKVRSAAAFALGEIGSATAQDSLLSALWREPVPSVAGRLAEALGRCGTEEALLAMVEHEWNPAIESARNQFVLSISRFALRQIKTDRAVWFCFDQLSDSNASVRWSALFALWRAAPLRVIDIEIAKRYENLQKYINDPSSDVRIHFATLLGRSRSSESIDLLKRLSVAEAQRREWRVQVAISRSLGAFVPTNPEQMSDFVSYLNSANDHVVVSTLQTLATLSPTLVSNDEGKETLEADLVRLSNARERPDLVRGEALVALGRHFPHRVDKALLTDPSSSLRLKSKVIEALSYSPSAETFKLFMEYLDDDDSVRVVMATWDFLRRIAGPFAIRSYMEQDTTLKDVHRMLFGKIQSSLHRNDMAITTLVANTVGDTLFFSFFHGTEFEEKIRDELAKAYQRFSSPVDTEVMQSVLEAMGKIGNAKLMPLLEKSLQDADRTVALSAASALKSITGKDYSQQVPTASKPLYSDYDWQTFESLLPEQTILVKTSKGNFTLQLMKDHAPFTVLNTVKLVRKGFYNGLPFHRVVPNFVIQGGDPRGDGWGGPGYAIRSEWSLVNYERGMVGVASSGKDTEGSQFFVVHSPQPHLDGRYTIFAKVIQGMEVVDTIQVGDRIMSMEALN